MGKPFSSFCVGLWAWATMLSAISEIEMKGNLTTTYPIGVLHFKFGFNFAFTIHLSMVSFLSSFLPYEVMLTLL